MKEHSIDKAHIEIGSLHDFEDEVNDVRYWLTRSPIERLEALEFLRRNAYQYDPFSERLQRLLEAS